MEALREGRKACFGGLEIEKGMEGGKFSIIWRHVGRENSIIWRQGGRENSMVWRHGGRENIMVWRHVGRGVVWIEIV